MSDTQQLSLSFSISTSIESYFIYLEQEEYENTSISLEEASEIIDSTFELDPCIDKDSTVTEEQEPIEEEEFDLLVFNNMNFSDCFIGTDGSFEAQIRVYISHETFPYKLIIENGSELNRIHVEEEVSVDVDVTGNSINVQKPIRQLISCSVPYLSYSGGSIQLDANYDSTVSLRYKSSYDLVTISVEGNPITYSTENGCRCIGFYKETVDELVITPPDEDENADSSFFDLYCNVSVKVNTPPDNVTCYEIHNRVVKCRCSGSEVSRTTNKVFVDCPKEYYCPGSETNCFNNLGSKTYTVGTVECAGEETEVNDPEYYEQTCCESITRSLLPQCKVQTLVYNGGKSIKGGADKYKNLYGDNTKFVAVGPRNGVCGSWTIEQQIKAKNCCDDVKDDPLTVNKLTSVEIISDYSNGLIYLTGGLSEIEWTVYGEDVWLDKNLTKRSIEGGRVARIYTGDTCGMISVVATDGCTSVEHKVRADTGSWQLIEKWDRDDPVSALSSPVISGDGTVIDISKGYMARELISGEYKIVEYYTSKYYGYHCHPVRSEHCCTTVYAYLQQYQTDLGWAFERSYWATGSSLPVEIWEGTCYDPDHCKSVFGYTADKDPPYCDTYCHYCWEGYTINYINTGPWYPNLITMFIRDTFKWVC